ncbi:MAG: GNAT family N-acetyltransferase [Candidatus Obscuribacter sp.]|nr:GNAT family N-acetyltransferase [Candidatus Obscuribacter sp.]
MSINLCAIATPTLTGPVATLPPITAAHVTDDYLCWLNDKHLMRFSRQRLRHHTRETSIAYQQTFVGTANHLWAIEATDSGELMGTINTYVDSQSLVADIGIMVGNPSARGRGLGKAAWGLVMAFLFNDLGMRKVTAGTVGGNIAMQKIAEHWQMRLEATLREQELIDDKPYDILRYGILKREWTSLPHR